MNTSRESFLTPAQAAGKLQEAMYLIHERLSIFLLDIISKSRIGRDFKRRLQNEVKTDDFCGLLLFITRKHWTDLCEPHGCTTDLQSFAEHAIAIHNFVSHQSLDVTHYESNLETLAKLATCIQEQDVAEKIRSFTSIQSNPTLVSQDNTWLKIKDEGNSRFKEKQWAEAMVLYTRALEVNPEEPVLYANRALCEIHLLKYDLARQDAEKALHLDRKQVKYHRILSEALLGLNLPCKARAVCVEGLKLDPCEPTLLESERLCSHILGTAHSCETCGENMPNISHSLPHQANPGNNDTSDETYWNYSFKNPTVFSEIKRRAASGSVTAQNICEVIGLMSYAEQKLENGALIEGLMHFRLAYYIYNPLPVFASLFREAAQMRLKLRPDDSDALFVDAILQERDNTERLRFLEHCIQLHPSAADFHYELADSYMTAKEYKRAEQSFTRALELRFNPRWLFAQTVAMSHNHQLQEEEKFKCGRPRARITDEDEHIVAGFKRFLELNPPDDKKVPAVHYLLGLQYLLRDDQVNARNHYYLGEAANSPALRLPCHMPISSNAKLTIESWVNGLMPSFIMEQCLLTTEPLCANCGKKKPHSKCVCQKLYYCDKACQKAHWNLHKMDVEHSKKSKK